MPVIFFLIVVLIFTAFYYWQVTLCFAVIGIVIYFVNKEIEVNRQRQAEAKAVQWRVETERARLQEEEHARKLAHQNQQQEFGQKLVQLANSSFELFEAMPKHLMTIEELLDEAERDFSDGAFAPFWDSVEQATLRLGHFDENVREITLNAQTYSTLVQRFEASPPPFPIVLDSVTGLATANATANRLRVVVRNAQRSFQFATIFEQRRTNQLLVAGFTSLAQALDGMGRHIESSITELENHVSMLSSSLGERLDSMNTTFENHMADQTERHKQALTMLGNIQGRRNPCSSLKV